MTSENTQLKVVVKPDRPSILERLGKLKLFLYYYNNIFRIVIYYHLKVLRRFFMLETYIH